MARLYAGLTFRAGNVDEISVEQICQSKPLPDGVTHHLKPQNMVSESKSRLSCMESPVVRWLTPGSNQVYDKPRQLTDLV